MSRIEVAPTALTQIADRLRTADLDARHLRRAFLEAGVEVTGSAELTAALREHADAWGWLLDRAHERVRSAAGAVDRAAAAYDEVEQAVAVASGR